jgi:aldehyde dehydrogenase (NAD+)
MSTKTISINGKELSIPTGLFINNEFVEAISKTTLAVENPATGEVVLTVQEGQAEDVDVAVQAATKAFNGPGWKDISPDERGKLLNRLADIMEQNREELIAIEMLDTGKTYKQASTIDFAGSVGTLRYYAGWAGKIVGTSSTNVPGMFSYTRREPIGVCGQIIPWK